MPRIGCRPSQPLDNVALQPMGCWCARACLARSARECLACDTARSNGPITRTWACRATLERHTVVARATVNRVGAPSSDFATARGANPPHAQCCPWRAPHAKMEVPPVLGMCTKAPSAAMDAPRQGGGRGSSERGANNCTRLDPARGAKQCGGYAAQPRRSIFIRCGCKSDSNPGLPAHFALNATASTHVSLVTLTYAYSR